MQTSGRKLLNDSLAIVRTFDPYALAVAIAATLVFVLLVDMNPMLSLVLGVATYLGITLTRPHREPAPLPIALTVDQESFALTRASAARVLLLTDEIGKPAVRRQVRAVQAKFARMLDVMQEDEKYGSTPDYYSLLVHPFERLLGEYVRLSGRKVPGASAQLGYFERATVPRTELVAEAFYQDYHQQPIIDLAALLEMHNLNLASLSPDDDEVPMSDIPEGDEDARENPP